MKICGIMISKEISLRFPAKNRILFKENAELLKKVCGLSNVYMISNDIEIIDKCCNMGIKTIYKNVNCHDELPYLEVLKHALYSLPVKYDVIVTILSNSIGHKAESIVKGIDILLRDNHVNDIRSFDEEGNQSGIFIFRANSLPYALYHQAAIFDNGKEIHYKEELEEYENGE